MPGLTLSFLSTLLATSTAALWAVDLANVVTSDGLAGTAVTGQGLPGHSVSVSFLARNDQTLCTVEITVDDTEIDRNMMVCLHKPAVHKPIRCWNIPAQQPLHVTGTERYGRHTISQYEDVARAVNEILVIHGNVLDSVCSTFSVEEVCCRACKSADEHFTDLLRVFEVVPE